MPVNVTLSTMSGKVVRGDRYSSKVLEITGESLLREDIPGLSNVEEIKAAVGKFGKRVRELHPEASFQVIIRLAKGCRKPRGYDLASNGNGFGQENFMHVEDQRTHRAEATAATLGAAP